MAYVNVRDWSVDQVMDWLKGLDGSILQYSASFLNNGVTGHQLLNLRSDDLVHLGVRALGHQEIILEAVEHLRNFHYELDKENLQMLAMRLSCAANSLYGELLKVDDDSSVVQTQTMSDVHNIITAIKPLVCWLDRAPFAGVKDYMDCKTQMLELSFEMATCAHRDIFSEKPVCTIRSICEKITKIADHMIQEISDPMILQPASLDLATLKKKEQELGFFILPQNQAIHQIAQIKYGSPAHGSSKIEEGDEIVQVNYQTVVGWQRKNVMLLLQDSPPEIVLTLKKRPRHTKVYGQIYMKPYRLPSKKRDGHPYSRWNDNIPSPRLLPIHNLPPIKITKLSSVAEPPDVETELSSSDSEPPDSPLDGSGRVYPLKPRPILQRRNTITGATPTNKRPFPPVEQYWQLLKSHATSVHSSSYNIDNAPFDTDPGFLRDKSASCNINLDLSPRPTTVIGISPNRNNLRKPSFEKEFKGALIPKKRVNFQEKKEPEPAQKEELVVPFSQSNLDEEKSVSVTSLASLNNETIAFIDEGRDLTDRTSMMVSGQETKPKDPVKDDTLCEVDIQSIIKKFDGHTQGDKTKDLSKFPVKKPPDVLPKPLVKKPAVPPRSATTKLRGRLDKSHSTPAYDLVEQNPGEKFELSRKEEIVMEVTQPASPDYFTETKYELGIPIVEAVNFPLTHSIPTVEEPMHSPIPVVVEKLQETIAVPTIELPPKPPPRTFGPVKVNKPAYPSDSPKPIIEDKIKPSNVTPHTKQVFEFPEVSISSTISSNYSTMDSRNLEPTTPLKASGSIDSKSSKSFDPKLTSTPRPRGASEFGNYEDSTIKAESSLDLHKITSETKISPTNSIVKAVMYANKSKVNKKKTSITAKRRKVTVNDLNPCDMQGFLYQRLRVKHNQSVHWEKRWFVLLDNYLYGFKSKDDPRAACLIFLAGFTVAVANEVKSRSNAFKVYHTGTVFYFSVEDPDLLHSWIEMITAATLHGSSSKQLGAGISDTGGILYSETDDSDVEKPKYSAQPSEKHTDSLKKFGSLKKNGSYKKSDEVGAASGSTSLDRKWFFNKSSSHSKNSLPVPTAQFRSYRKIRTDMGGGSVTTGNFTSHVPSFAPRTELSKMHQSQNVSVPNLMVDHLPRNNAEPTQSKDLGKLAKMKPLNYMHASNPSLCNVTDFNVPTFSKKSFKQSNNDNLSGFVTLEELMIKQSEERKSNPYNMSEDLAFNLNLIKPDVVYGEVPIRPSEKAEVPEKKPDIAESHCIPASGNISTTATTPTTTPNTAVKKGHSRNASDSPKGSDKQNFGSTCFGKRFGSLKKSSSSQQKEEDEFESKTATYPKATRGLEDNLNRSLPRTHKLQDTVAHYASDRNLSFEERSYEMIYCPETMTDVQFAQNRHLDDWMCKETKESAKKKSKSLKKQHSFRESDKKGSRSYLDSSKYTNKISDSSSSKVKLKSAVQYTPMSLPLAQDPKCRPKLAFELNLDDRAAAKTGKFNKIFGKQNSEKEKKEKTFLGSPKLHRAIFRKNSTPGMDLSWPSGSTQNVSTCSSAYYQEHPTPQESCSMNISPHADYPGLEYPPVFEPETYSLADPESSLTLLRKQGKNK